MRLGLTLAAGRDNAVYTTLLNEINTERTGLLARQRMLEETQAQTPQEDPKEAVEVAQEIARGMKQILTSDHLDAGEKNAYFCRFIQEIRPAEDGFRAVLRLFRIGFHAVPVAFGPSMGHPFSCYLRFREHNGSHHV